MYLTIVFMNTFCRIIFTSKATFHIVQFGKFGLGWAKKINIMSDAQDPYEPDIYFMRENIQVENAKTKSNGRKKSRDSPKYCSHHEEPKGGVAKL